MNNSQKLLKRFRKTKSPRHFSALYDHCTPRLYGMALRLVAGDHSEAEELVQETWFRAVSDLDRFRGESEFTTWLIGILLNCSRERVRKMALKVPQDLEPTWGDDPMQGVGPTLAALPRGYREVLLLHDLAGYTHAEIGDYFGIVEGTSKSQLSRARAAFRKLLIDEDEST